jgi:hypothetical protein
MHARVLSQHLSRPRTAGPRCVTDSLRTPENGQARRRASRRSQQTNLVRSLTARGATKVLLRSKLAKGVCPVTGAFTSAIRHPSTEPRQVASRHQDRRGDPDHSANPLPTVELLGHSPRQPRIEPLAARRLPAIMLAGPTTSAPGGERSRDQQACERTAPSHHASLRPSRHARTNSPRFSSPSMARVGPVFVAVSMRRPG